jgi:hypothetical protein
MGDAIKRVVSQLKSKSPASEREIDSARTRIGFHLPKDFLEFYRHSNGLSGNLEPSGEHLVVWPIGKLVENNAAYNVSDYAPGICIFGSNGSGEAYGFDTRQPNLPVVMIPFIGMELRYARPIASSFTEFLHRIPGCSGKRHHLGIFGQPRTLPVTAVNEECGLSYMQSSSSCDCGPKSVVGIYVLD